jgi:ABC-type dipeptide/oligopeptide/nickel transport system ATPase component
MTKQIAVVVGSSGCGKSGQTTKKDSKGQVVEFTIKSPVALCKDQSLRWQDITTAGA